MLGQYTKFRNDTGADDLVSRWFALLDRGIAKRKDQEERWSTNENFEDMKQWRGVDGELHEGDYDQPTINKLGSYIRTYRAAISYKDPGVKMIPRNAAAWETIRPACHWRPVSRPRSSRVSAAARASSYRRRCCVRASTC